MTTMIAIDTAAPAAPVGAGGDRRGSWIPTLSMITTRIMELRKRRGLMIAMVVVNIGVPSLFLIIRLLAHAFAPKSYGPAGGYDIYTALVAGVMYVFGFIVAATLGCTAGSVDLTEGMFRHMVVTGRSRLALYLARIPAGLAIVVPVVAIGFTVVCTVCVLAAPTQLNYSGVNVPANLSRLGFENWAGNHAHEVVCEFPIQFQGPQSDTKVTQAATVTQNVNCNNGPGGQHVFKQPPGAVAPPQPTQTQIRNAARTIAGFDYADYSGKFLYPSNSLMIKSGLWLELEAAIGFIVGLGLASLIGQRTVAVVLMIVLEVILTPIVATHVIPHLINAQRAVVGLATAHLEPGGLPFAFGGGGGGSSGPGSRALVPESTTVAVCVIVAWLVGWSALGAWRMMTRDA